MIFFFEAYKNISKLKTVAKLLKGIGVATIQRKITLKYTHTKKKLFSAYKMVLMKVFKGFQS